MKRSETLSLPPVWSAIELDASTVDAANRTVEATFYSGAPILRMPLFEDPFELEFEVTRKAADLTRLNGGASLIDSHGRTGAGVGAIMGVVEKAWLADGKARALLRFSRRADVEPFWQDVQDRVIRNVSMGTFVHAMEEVTAEGAKLQRYRATSWQPYEISLVATPADAGAQIQAAADAGERHECTVLRAEASADAPHKGKTMTIKVRLLADGELGKRGELVEIDEESYDEKLHLKEIEAAPPTDAATVPSDTKSAQRAVDDAIQADKEYAAQVRRVTQHFELDDIWAQQQIRLGNPISQVIKAAATRRAQVAPRINDLGVSGDDRDSAGYKLDRMAEALAARAKRKAPPEAARAYAHHTLVEMAFECLSFTGRNRGLDVRAQRSRIIELALTTSDYPNLLANAANKILLPDYEAAQPTYRLLAERQDLPDFKTASVLKAGDFPVPLEVAEEGEIKLGSFSEAKDVFALATYGRRLLFSFQAIVNDDLGAFERIMRSAARRLADFENGIWFTLLTSASGAGPTLGDGGALFNATAITTAGGHANLTSSGTAISVDSLGVGRAAMKKQQSLDGIKLNLQPRYLLTSPEKQTIGEQYTTVITPALGSSVNPFAGKLETISDANLVTANPWYLFADPSMAPVSVYGYLQGQAGPDVATRQGFEVLGVELRVALHFGTAFIDFRGAYRNAGA
jgi:hypothetical protein